ncbi:MAG: gluconeogenesis factor YvcK family protein [Dethiobacteria bacterium]
MFNYRLLQSKLQSIGKWLYPGLGIKRWLLVFLCGLILFFWGLALFLGPEAFNSLSLRLQSLESYIGERSAEYGIFVLLSGIVLLLLGVQRLFRSVSSSCSLWHDRRSVEVLFNRRYLERGPKIVAIGGGTGLSTLLRGLKEYTSNITAVVTVTDDGGSSGRLRGELGILPPGDIRACLLALADTEPLMESLFGYRFRRGKTLEGHSFGNIFIAAMTDILGFEAALQEFSKVLAVRGRVLPVTLDNIRLIAEDEQGKLIYGETNISLSKVPIKRIFLDPPHCRPLPEVLQAIREADAIVMGPGSLLTSVLPNLLVPQIAEAIRESKAPRFYICNIMTQAGETDDFSAADHLETLQRYAGRDLVDYIVVNTQRFISRRVLERYHEEGAKIVDVDFARLNLLGIKILAAPLLNKEEVVRHDPHRLARLIMERIAKDQSSRERRFWEYSLYHINGKLREKLRL